MIVQWLDMCTEFEEALVFQVLASEVAQFRRCSLCSFHTMAHALNPNPLRNAEERWRVSHRATVVVRNSVLIVSLHQPNNSSA